MAAVLPALTIPDFWSQLLFLMLYLLLTDEIFDLDVPSELSLLACSWIGTLSSELSVLVCWLVLIRTSAGFTEPSGLALTTGGAPIWHPSCALISSTDDRLAGGDGGGDPPSVVVRFCNFAMRSSSEEEVVLDIMVKVYLSVQTGTL